MDRPGTAHPIEAESFRVLRSRVDNAGLPEAALRAGNALLYLETPP